MLTLNTKKQKLNVKLNKFFDNPLFIFTFITMILKSIIFLGITYSPNTSKISFLSVPFYYLSPTVYFGFPLIILSIGLFFKGSIQKHYYIIMNILYSILILGDTWHYRGFQSFLSPHLLKETSNLNNLSDAVISMARPIDILFFIDILLMLIFIKKINKPYRCKRAKLKLPIFLITFGIVILSLYHYVIDTKHLIPGKTFLKIEWNANQTMAQLSPIGYHIYDSYIYFKESKVLVLNKKEQKEINDWFKYKNESLPSNNYSSLLKGKNLICIQVESLEEFVINQKINSQEITPNINKLLKNSIYFPNIYEQVNMGTSSDSDLMVNTSVYPVRSGSTFFRYPSNSYNSLPKLLNGLNYTTLAAHPDKGSYWNWLPSLKSMEFEKLVDEHDFNLDEKIGLGLSDASYLKQLSQKISKLDTPFYSFFVTLTSHGPFNLPKDLRELNLPKDLNSSKLGGYFQSVHYTDKHIGKFIESLDKNGMLDNSVIVIFGDHTGVHKYYKDELKNINPKEDWWYKDNLRIPFIIYSKNLKPETKDVIGGQIDILPTLANLIGIPEKDYIYSSMGRNLLNTNKSFAILSNGTIIGSLSKEDKKHALNGLEIADTIIRSNYFKHYFKK